MFLLILLSTLVIQVLVYKLADRFNGWYIKWSLFALTMVFYIFLLPRNMLPDPQAGSAPECGMPLIAIYFTCVVLGGGSTLMVHFSYWLIRFLKREKRPPLVKHLQ